MKGKSHPDISMRSEASANTGCEKKKTAVQAKFFKTLDNHQRVHATSRHHFLLRIVSPQWMVTALAPQRLPGDFAPVALPVFGCLRISFCSITAHHYAQLSVPGLRYVGGIEWSPLRLPLLARVSAQLCFGRLDLSITGVQNALR